MAILRADEIRKMGAKEVSKKMIELKLELAKMRGGTSMGASPPSPGRIGELRRTIARMKTIESEKARLEKDKSAPAKKNKPASESKEIAKKEPGKKK